MVTLTKITGEVSGNLIRVRLRTGEEFMATMMVSGFSPAPSAQWITDNKDNFLAVTEFEGKEITPIPIVLGFYPVKGADSVEYNSVEKLLKVATSLVEQLTKAKVNTQIGPQPFLPDSVEVFKGLKNDLDEIGKSIYNIKL